MAGKPKDLRGQRFGRWLVLEQGPSRPGYAVWLCRCDCGTERLVRAQSLIRGRSASCGCALIEKQAQGHGGKYRHGMTGSSEHWAWIAMRHRCSPDAHPESRRYYYERGITVDPRWESFEAFLADIGPSPGPGYTLERLDNDGPYAPGNVVWATPRQQSNNTRRNRWLTYDGKTLTVAQWAREVGLPVGAIYARLALGWPVDLALTTPVQRGQKLRR